VLFAGTDRGLEARVLPKLGFAFETVRSAGLVGTGLGGKIRSLALQVLGLADAGSILRRFRPQACLGVGGYSSFPVVSLASLRGVPSAVQEQNAKPGLTNRVLARLVRRVYAGDEAAVGQFPAAKVRFTGNPLRRALSARLPYEPPASGKGVRILVLGGSQGARVLNEVVPPALAAAGLEVEVWHQAGKGKTEGVAARYAGRAGARIAEFIDDMSGAYGWAQLVICRAGALTLAELASAGRPAILVPFPFAAGGHQEANARAAEARGAATMILERDLKPETLAKAVRELAADPRRLEAMADAADRSARRDAARVIVEDLLELGRN
jgi:UDP-N-acetylglucosamine--N-acetylmuramyl-(pentapeptide) pyrophosphoryl-undecaprenol N-acetylglucosamine transferase